MSQTDNKMNGALAGLAISAAAYWARYDDDTQRRLRNFRADAEEALDLIRELQSRGEMIRSRLPIVNDAQIGLALANPTLISPTVIPSVSKLSRPELTSDAASNLSWPPKTGTYDGKGNVSELGEMTALFLALTFEEPRAFLLGLTQAKSPSAEGKLQINMAAHEMIAVLAALKLTDEQYRAAWLRLFTGAVSGIPAAVTDPHRDPSRPPSVMAATGNGIESVVLLSSATVPNYPYRRFNTDAGMTLRISASAAGSGIPASTTVAEVRYSSEYKFRQSDGSLLPFAPSVVTGRKFTVASATSTGFQLVADTAVLAGSSFDAQIITEAGVATEQ